MVHKVYGKNIKMGTASLKSFVDNTGLTVCWKISENAWIQS